MWRTGWCERRMIKIEQIGHIHDDEMYVFENIIVQIAHILQRFRQCMTTIERIIDIKVEEQANNKAVWR